MAECLKNRSLPSFPLPGVSPSVTLTIPMASLIIYIQMSLIYAYLPLIPNSSKLRMYAWKSVLPLRFPWAPQTQYDQNWTHNFLLNLLTCQGSLLQHNPPPPCMSEIWYSSLTHPSLSFHETQSHASYIFKSLHFFPIPQPLPYLRLQLLQIGLVFILPN